MAASSQKDKLLEEAQKLVMRGQLDRAVKVYEQVLALEPSAINQRQKLAEILIKAGRPDDAAKELETIGNHFSKNGFYLKAIAVFKQLQKLFPADIRHSITLAGLNEKHGLTANALSEYRQVYDYYEKAGNVSESLKILDKMQAVDPQNISVKIKLAEAYFQHDKKEDAYALFVKTASLLQERGDNAGVSKLTTRILQLFPDKSEFMLEVLTGQVMSGNAAGAIISLQGLLRSNPGDKRIWDLIVEAYKRLGQPQKVKLAYQHYHKMLPDEPAPMAGLIFCCVAERDVAGALELLDLYENNLMATGSLGDLDKLYRTLEEIDPINIRVLEGLIRVVKAAGNEDEVLVLSDKLKHFYKASEKSEPGAAVSESVASLSESPDFFSTTGIDSSLPSETQTEHSDVLYSVDSDSKAPDAIAPETESEFVELDDLTSSMEDDIEIELDFDDVSDLVSNEKTVGNVRSGDDRTDSVGDLFDTITTAPSGIKYSSDMDSSDAESHFDLGLAFREMGLYDEAINEFRKASSDNTRRIVCLIMQGACLRDRGEFDTAINMLNTLLKPSLNLDDSCAVKYELALTYEAAGKTDESAQLLNEIDSANPDFRDVSSRLKNTDLANSLDFSDEDLKNF